MVLDFGVEMEERESVPILHVKGEIDIYTSPKFRKDLKEMMEKHHQRLILNLEKVQYIDSTGLGAIAHVAHALEQDDGRLYVVCSRPQVKKIFNVSGLMKKNVLLFDEESLALSSIQGK